MLNPTCSVMIILHTQGLGEETAAFRALSRVVTCAEALSIPILSAYYPMDARQAMIGNGNLSSRAFPHYPFEPDVETWQGTELGTAIADTGRRQLLICGGWLEEGVTLLAHRALRTGLDVFVCIDASLALQKDHVVTLQMRLIQHNAVVTTAEQAVREWLALSPSEKY